jgi:hypothetical protein
MEEDESTNQNSVKKTEFLWITGHFHFGMENATYLWSSTMEESALYTLVISYAKKSGASTAPEILP